MNTLSYTRLHRALADVAREEGIEPYQARVLLAVADLGGSVRSDQLEIALGDRGAATRRALVALYRSGHAGGTGPDGGRRKRGCRTTVSLTIAGVNAANRIIALAEESSAS